MNHLARNHGIVICRTDGGRWETRSAAAFATRAAWFLCLCLSLTLLYSSANGDPPAKPRSPTKSPREKSPSSKSPSSKSPGAKSPDSTRNSANQDDPQPPPNPAAVPVYRPSDARPRHDDDQLKKRGILKYASKRLLLYTDIEPALARPLPPLMDQAYVAWEAYFGPLPPDRKGADFQMTGYIMSDRERFVAAGLLPEALPGFVHGRHRGAEFWMNDQTDDYYRRHLMLHEGTHCFMTIVPNVMLPFVFYMEGMAELFGTHLIDSQGHVQFGVMPKDKEQFPGLGRIRMIHDEVQKEGPRDFLSVVRLEPPVFAKNEAYAWSWALCQFLNNHPRYRERFRHVREKITAASPLADFLKLFEREGRDLPEEWLLFGANLCHGYDIERAAIDFKTGTSLGSAGGPHKVPVAADRGWQSSGAEVEQGKGYRVTATGRFILATEPKPWESEPQGVSIRYCDGKPLGMLVGTVRSAALPGKSPWTTMLSVIPLGSDAAFVAPLTGTLYLRLNDFWNELADNSGSANVEIRAAAR